MCVHVVWTRESLLHLVMLGKVKTFGFLSLRTRPGLSKCFLGGGCGGLGGWMGGVAEGWVGPSSRGVIAGEAGPLAENKGPVGKKP